ncbi:hypothetical protein F511_42105 [Dorcoceras hygrometricum]|uniref:Uncharacterized protein n=1 Tax=Dorcoceras hygrometricum TaxID=472368 RepID=A0A2Z7D5H2_9LAMI|nr:hypothetical protein F511_42105 [Dorcoceras hygrometricum]
MHTADHQMESQPSPIPDIPAGGHKDSTAGGPEVTMETIPMVAKQADDESIAGGPEGRVGKTTENGGRVDNVEQVEQVESINQTEKEAATNEETIMVRWLYLLTIEKSNSTAHKDLEDSTQAGSQHISLPTTQIMDNIAKELTSLKDNVSSLDLKVERIKDDSNFTRHSTVQLRRQLETSVDELEIKIDVL